MTNTKVRILIKVANTTIAKILHRVLDVDNKIRPENIYIKQTLDKDSNTIIFEIQTDTTQIGSINYTVDDYLFTLKLILNTIKVLQGKYRKSNLKC